MSIFRITSKDLKNQLAKAEGRFADLSRKLDALGPSDAWKRVDDPARSELLKAVGEAEFDVRRLSDELKDAIRLEGYKESAAGAGKRAKEGKKNLDALQGKISTLESRKEKLKTKRGEILSNAQAALDSARGDEEEAIRAYAGAVGDEAAEKTAGDALGKAQARQSVAAERYAQAEVVAGALMNEIDAIAGQVASLEAEARAARDEIFSAAASTQKARWDAAADDLEKIGITLSGLGKSVAFDLNIPRFAPDAVDVSSRSIRNQARDVSVDEAVKLAGG
jgi:chromosome segregation ATPase